MGLAFDQGSDDVCTDQWLIYKKANATTHWDCSHGGKRDWKFMLNDCDLWNFWLLFMCVMNTASGPSNENTRWAELDQAWSEMLDNLAPSDCALAMENLEELIEAVGGRDALPVGMSAPQGLWSELRNHGPTREIVRVNLNRFWDSPRKAKTFVCRWPLDRLNREYLALESGALTTRLASKFVMAASGPSADRTTTDSSKLSAADRAMRNSQQSAVVCSVGMYSEPCHERFVRLLITAGEPTEQWHGAQNQRLRSSHDTKEWLIEQVSGGLMKHIEDTLMKTEDLAALEYCKVLLPSAVGENEIPALNDVVVYEDEMCALLGKATTSMASRRGTRTLWIMSWPVAFAGLNGTDGLKIEIVNDFKADVLASRAFDATVPRTASMAKVHSRLLVERTNVQQYVEAHEFL
jgi:hypothetical protein